MKILLTALAAFFIPALVHGAPLSLEWAGQTSSNATVTNPGNATGAPDGDIANFPENSSAVYSGFGSTAVTNADSLNLSTLLGITETELASGNFIAFEHNGSNGFNFESATWEFSDGTDSITAAVSESNPGATSQVRAFGDISYDDYATFFGFNYAPTPAGEVVFLLFDLGDLDLDTLTLSALDSPNHGTPDPDAFAVISNVPIPAAAWLFVSAIGGLVVAKRKQLKA